MEEQPFRELSDHLPHTLTILCTYKCTAACEQCCFESSPRIKGRLTIAAMRARIDEAYSSFKGLQLVVFSGGEAFLLKDDLYAAIKHSTSLGLSTRVVTNGFWGKTAGRAADVADKLIDAGLTEINISTGADHERWVPQAHVINAVVALTTRCIQTMVTVEAETKTSRCFERLLEDPKIQSALATAILSIQRNSWMQFKEGHQSRIGPINREELRNGCRQLFGNIVVTPHDNVSACCGLTLEHIPEMRIGSSTESIKFAYETQFGDFLKYWIAVDGPYRILEHAIGRNHPSLSEVTHICQACVRLHRDIEVRDELRRLHPRHAASVMARFALNLASTKSQASIEDDIA